MISTTEKSFQNPAGYEINFETLETFERGLDTIHPERSQVPCHVLGYGEMSTVFEIHADTMDGLAFKRMSVFETPEELSEYLDIYLTYNRLLEEEIEVRLPAHGHAAFVNQNGRPIFYIIQGKLSSPSIGNKAMHLLPYEETLTLFECALGELHKVWMFNKRQDRFEVGVDGQISNWVLADFDPEHPHIEKDACLLYVDTSTPLFRDQGVEQMDAELFLRPAPSFLAWILRLLYVKDVVDRYYDFRRVSIDLLANCYKEQKPELIPDLVGVVNTFYKKEAAGMDLPPLEEGEVLSYYREDAQIWSLYLSMRRIDRRLHWITRREYPYILPGPVTR